MVKSVLHSLLPLALGTALGWWAHDYVAAPASQHGAANVSPQTPDVLVLPALRDLGWLVTDTADQSPPSFAQLLASGEHAAAVDYYAAREQLDDPAQPALKRQLLQYLSGAGADDFLQLVDIYLDRYYADIDVLLLLAQHHASQAYFDEALRDLQMAATYAHQDARRQQVDAALAALVERVDAQWSGQQRWAELLGFYELLYELDLASGAQRLRQAQLYVQLDDERRADAVLSELLEHPDYGERADQLLAALAAEVPDGQVQQVEARLALPLQRHASHYLLQAQLGDSDALTLMIDTGASVTTLSQERFEALDRAARYQQMGVRLFHTANGVVRGTVYRAPEFQLGEFVLENVEVAVLEHAGYGVVDGLLGMNVLRQFRFEIDQGQALLYLQPR